MLRLLIIIAISFSSANVSITGNITQKISTIHDHITRLYMIKYYILLYGIRSMQINDIDIPGLNHELLAHLINSSISLNTLTNSFPRFSMLVVSKQTRKLRGHFVFDKFHYAIDIVKWNFALCQALWTPSPRSEMVYKIKLLLEQTLPAYSLNGLEQNLESQLMNVKSMLDSLNGTLSPMSQKWLQNFNLFYAVWDNVCELLKLYKANLTTLLMDSNKEVSQ